MSQGGREPGQVRKEAALSGLFGRHGSAWSEQAVCQPAGGVEPEGGVHAHRASEPSISSFDQRNSVDTSE